jgi:GNAT superfamily N-acetyltransferase
MNVNLRPPTAADTEACGRIIYEAFFHISTRHHFRPDFPSPEVATEFVRALIESPSVYGVVAESDGRLIGSNFLWEYDEIRAVGPITIDPQAQGHGVGRRLMEAVIERGRDAAGIRLVQGAFNTTSMSLYTSLGFDIKEPLVLMEGQVKETSLADDIEVRPLKDEDYAACDELCRRVHGISRLNEMKATPPVFTPFVAVRDGRVTAYASAIQFWALNHAVAESVEDMQALLAGASAQSEAPLSFLFATRQASLFRWCLKQGLRVLTPMTLMTMGKYQEPRGAYLPSVGY